MPFPPNKTRLGEIDDLLKRRGLYKNDTVWHFLDNFSNFGEKFKYQG